jgi:hypothetical protein
MDGGSLVINKNGKVQTVWRREGNIFTAVLGIPEIGIGKGRNCIIGTINNENNYCWSDKDEILYLKANDQKNIR